MIGKIILFAVLVSAATAVIPPYMKICKKNDPNITMCIVDAVMGIRSKLAHGIPELNVPPIEPLVLGLLQLRSGSESAKINANITNLNVWGPSSFEVTELKPNLAKNRYVFRVKISQIYFKGDYDLDMHVVILDYKGQGPITGNFSDLTLDVLMKGKVIKINKNNHLHFDKFTIHMNIGKTSLHLGNLFEKDPAIGRATNEVVNENSDTFVKEIQSALEAALAEKFTYVANNITRYFTYEELFPES